jgi:probable F420-dependent oxidoreductase
MVVPHRPAVLAAKILSTIDVLSGGRLTVGIGAGWLQEEFEAIGAHPFAARGAVTDEYLQAFRALWTEDDPRFTGSYVKFGGIVFAPKPVQKPHPPIWVGGESGPALRRSVRLGDAWYPIGTNPAHPLDSLARYRAGIDRLRKIASDAGRDPMSVGLAYRCSNFGEGVPMKASDGDRRLFSGGPAEIAGDLRALAAPPRTKPCRQCSGSAMRSSNASNRSPRDRQCGWESASRSTGDSTQSGSAGQTPTRPPPSHFTGRNLGRVLVQEGRARVVRDIMPPARSASGVLRRA